MDDKDKELLVRMEVSMDYLAENVGKLERLLDTRMDKLEVEVSKRLDDQDSQLRGLAKVVYGTPAALIVGIIGLWLSGGITFGG